MARSLHANLVATLSADEINPFYALKLEFDSGDLYLWTGNGNRVIEGNTYIGAEDFLTIPQMEETLETAATGLAIQLAGVPSTLISVALDERYQNRKATLYYGDKSVSEVSIIYEGLMDQMPIDEGPETSTVSLSVEHELAMLERIAVRRYTSASQKVRYPNDLGFEYINSLTEIYWTVK